MISHPKIGQCVRVHYKKSVARIAPYQDRVGYIQEVSRGPGPRNVCVDVDGALVMIPRGNLNMVEK